MNMRLPILMAAGAVLLGAALSTPTAAQDDEPKAAGTKAQPPRGRVAPAPAAPEDGRRLRVAILDFFERTPYSKMKGSLGHATALTLAVELDKTGRYEVYAREDLEQALAELRIEPGSLITEPAAARVGRLAKVDYVIYGDIEKLEVGQSEKQSTQSAKVVLNYKTLAVDSGRVWRDRQFTANAIGSPTDDSREVTERAIQKTIEDFIKSAIPDPTGKVALVDTDKGRFVINMGAANGITRGTYFQVVRLGREIRDPDSGEIIEREREVVCWGRVADVTERTASLEPGQYSKSDIGVVRWKSRRSKLDEIRVGDVVQIADGRKTLY